MDLALDKIKEVLLANDKIAIVVCKNPSLDQMGAALALYLALAGAKKNVSVVCPTDPIVEIANLVGINKVKKSLEQEDGDLVVSFPYQEGEIEKISYTLEGGFLNIVVKAGEKGLSFDEKSVAYKRGGAAAKVIFAVGASRLSDLGTISEIEALKDTTIINIDNKETNQGFGDIVLVSKNLSISEDVAKIIFNLGFKLDIDIAQNLLSGICSSTDNFQNSRTSPLAFEMGAILMKNGAVRNGKREVVKTDLVEEKSFAKTISEDKKKTQANPPEDWLTPKIYKGSTSV